MAATPAADHEAIVHQLEGRRINLARPEESLLLLKPTENLDHGGGGLFSEDDEAGELIIRWIAAGAERGAASQLQSLQVELIGSATTLNVALPLRATAHYADGSTRDVTEWTVWTAEDDTAAAIDAHAATARLLRRGRHIVVARFLDQVVPLALAAPLTDEPVDLSDEPRRNFIDEHVLGALTQLRLPPSPRAGDAEFLRRATLDLTGRLPTTERVHAFLTNAAADKRDPGRRRVARLRGVRRVLDVFSWRSCSAFARRATTRPAPPPTTLGSPPSCARAPAIAT